MFKREERVFPKIFPTLEITSFAYLSPFSNNSNTFSVFSKFFLRSYYIALI